MPLEVPCEKLQLLEIRKKGNKNEKGNDEHVKELSRGSFKPLINQLETSIVRFQTHPALRQQKVDSSRRAFLGVSIMTLAHRIEAVISQDGKLTLDHLPFRAGQTVEVIVLPVSHATTPCPTLRGTVQHYEYPTAPVAEDDWSALQ